MRWSVEQYLTASHRSFKHRKTHARTQRGRETRARDGAPKGGKGICRYAPYEDRPPYYGRIRTRKKNDYPNSCTTPLCNYVPNWTAIHSNPFPCPGAEECAMRVCCRIQEIATARRDFFLFSWPVAKCSCLFIWIFCRLHLRT